MSKSATFDLTYFFINPPFYSNNDTQVDKWPFIGSLRREAFVSSLDLQNRLGVLVVIPLSLTGSLFQ